eukprot:348079_1
MQTYPTDLTAQQKLQLAQRANQLYVEQLERMEKYLESLRSLIPDKEHIISQLTYLYNLEHIKQDPNRQSDNLLPHEFYPDLVMEELRQKANGLTIKIVSQNIELLNILTEYGNYQVVRYEYRQNKSSNHVPVIMSNETLQSKDITIEQKVTLVEKENETYRQQLKYRQDHLASLRSLIMDKEYIIENLMIRYDAGRISNNNTYVDEIELDEVRRKAEAKVQRSILENYELWSMVNGLHLVWGFIKNNNKILMNDNIYYNIPKEINKIVFAYFYTIK